LVEEEPQEARNVLLQTMEHQGGHEQGDRTPMVACREVAYQVGAWLVASALDQKVPCNPWVLLEADLEDLVEVVGEP